MEAQYAEATTEELVKKALDAWNRHDLATVHALYHQDLVTYGPFAPEGRRGLEANKKSNEDALAAFPDLHFKLSNLVTKGDMAWYELEATGTHKAPFQTPMGPIPATNKFVKLRMAFFDRASKGKLVEERSYTDVADLMRQLGLGQK